MTTSSAARTTRQVFVSGGTSGIGAAIAQAFAQTGAKVTATGATEAEVQTATQHAPDVHHQVLDVRDGAAVKALLHSLGPLDVVVNCAGIIQRQAELDPEAFELSLIHISEPTRH